MQSECNTIHVQYFEIVKRVLWNVLGKKQVSEVPSFENNRYSRNVHSS